MSVKVSNLQPQTVVKRLINVKTMFASELLKHSEEMFPRYSMDLDVFSRTVVLPVLKGLKKHFSKTSI